MGRNCFRAEALTHICACNRILNVRTNSQILGLLPLGQNHNFFVCWFCFFYFMFGLDVMRIRKIINNNVVYSEEKGKPVILIGKGIGFAKKVGDHIPEQAIDQIFLPDSQVKFSSIIKVVSSIFRTFRNHLVVVPPDVACSSTFSVPRVSLACTSAWHTLTSTQTDRLGTRRPSWFCA